MANIVGERFQITIDRSAREELGIRPGDLAVERVEDGRLVVEFVPQAHSRSLRGILRRPDEVPITDWTAYRDAAWAARGREIDAVLEADSRRHGTTRRRPGS